MSLSFYSTMFQEVDKNSMELIYTPTPYSHQGGLLTYISTNQTTLISTTSLPMTNLTNTVSYEEICDISKIATLENISYTLFMIIMLFLCLAGNGLVITATAYSKNLRSRVTVYFIVSLACSDFLFGMTFIPYLISMKIYDNRFCHGKGLCYAIMASDIFINVASMLNLLLIAIDRFIAINFPFKYIRLLTYKNAKIGICGVWIFAILWTIAGTIQWDVTKQQNTLFSIDLTSNYFCHNPNLKFYDATYFGVYLTSLIAMTFLYLKILHVAIQQIRSMEASTVILTAVNTMPVSPVRCLKDQRESVESLSDYKEYSKNKEAKKKSSQRKRKRELKATKSVAIVYFAYLICWFPNLIINMLLSIDNEFFLRMKMSNETLFYFIYYLFLQILPVINFMLNPIIYSFSNKQFRKGFIAVLYRITGRYNSSKDYLVNTRRDTRGISLSNVTSTTLASSASDYSVTSGNQSTQSSIKTDHRCKISDVSTAPLHKKTSKVSFGDIHVKDSTIIWRPD